MARHRKSSPKKPSFFKILIGDFSQRLRIPPKFIENFNGQSLRKCALRGPSRQWWDVKLEERENSLFFRDGWQGFVKDHALEVGDLLVFSFNGKSKFKVKIYDRSACEKNVEVAERRSGSPVSLVNKGNQAQVKDEIVELDTEDCENKMIDSDRRSCRYPISEKRPVSFCVQETSTGSILFKSENPCFLVCSRKQHLLYRVTIPNKLAVAEGLRRRDAVMLQDPTGRSWLVELRVECLNRLDMAIGWTECRKANQISPGDSIIFELVKQGVMQIHIFRKGAVGGNRLSVITAAPNVKN
ncbi:hypothetical protein ACE6H2_014523 [Prunus campanulata]